MQKNYLSNLNNQQLEAVTSSDGPLLVLAGAGTGKTKVLTTRICHLINEINIEPEQILAVTFTNKAAREMGDRIRNMVGASLCPSWIGTFHSLSARILRLHGHHINIQSNFTIIDIDEQNKIIKQILGTLGLEKDNSTAKNYLFFIGKIKDKCLKINDINQMTKDHGLYLAKIEDVAIQYQRRCSELNALDFGDLLIEAIRLMSSQGGSLFASCFKNILVDEYQDTNKAQHVWLKKLVAGCNNICAVGDDDQSIYGWRGAEIANILSFEHEYRGAKIIRLEENYRSTGHILGAASKIIGNNKARHGKNLWTSEGDGEKIKVDLYPSDRSEVASIIKKIENLKHIHSLDYSKIAILVRAGYQTRLFEEIMICEKIPYQIVGGIGFYSRSEIKDLLCYMRLVASLSDDLAFERIVNIPRRGYGDKTATEIATNAKMQNISLFKSLEQLLTKNEIKGKLAATMREFVDTILTLGKSYSNGDINVSELAKQLVAKTGYISYLESDRSGNGGTRADNVKEFVGSLSSAVGLMDFLNDITLASNASMDCGVDGVSKVNIMTFHGAKGLEFDAVFLPGWEEGIFPSYRSISEHSTIGVEEERRLAYVAITRAKKYLYISHCSSRQIFGQWQYPTPSRFIDELPSEHSETNREKPKVVSYVKTETKALVYHQKFGKGTVLADDGRILTISFDGGSVKQIAKEYVSSI